MPELPEVETIRRGMRLLLGQKVVRVIVRVPKLVSPSNLPERLARQSIRRLDRRGKMLVLQLSSGDYLLIHLKMTGQLVLRPKSGQLVVGGHPIINVEDVPNKFTHVEIHFRDLRLYFNDTRRFGYLKLVKPSQYQEIAGALGVEPLSRAFTPAIWQGFLKKKKSWRLKKLLLDQSLIAGLGNIYADEACFLARVCPQRVVATLTVKERQALFTAIGRVLRLSLKHQGTSFNTYRDAHGRRGNFSRLLNVYGRAGNPCRRCGSVIKKMRLVGRGTSYCPSCQR